MAVDPISRHLLLVGGDAYSGGVNAAGQWVDHWAPNEGTWLWDGSNWNRAADNPVQGGYPALAVYQPTHQLLANFAPSQVGPGPGSPTTAAEPPKPTWYSSNENNVFEWTGSGWTRIVETWGNTGALAEQAAAAYDPISRRVIQFGGMLQGGFGDVLAYDGAAWHFLTDSTPNELQGTALAFTDEAAGQIVMLAGVESWTASPHVPATWTWDGGTWVPHHLAEPPFDVLYPGHGQLVWDAGVQRAILVGYTGSGALQMWAWTGLTAGWYQVPS